MKKLWTKFKNLRLWRVIGGAFRVVGNSIRRFFGFVGRHWRAATLIGLAVAIALGTFLALFLTLPVKSVEIEGEVILLQGESYAGGLNVKATTKAGLVHREEVLTSMLSGYDPNVVGDQEVTVTYKRKKVKATVKVLSTAEVELRVREGTLPVSYEPNDPLGRRGVLDLYYGERLIRSVPVTRENATGFSTVLSGNYSIFLNYKGLLARYEYTVLEVIESITPAGALYAAQGQDLSKQNALGNMRLHIVYKDGREEDVPLFDERVTIKDGAMLEERGEDYATTLTFSYKGIEVACPVVAYSGELLAPRSVTLRLDRTVYVEGEDFDYGTAYLEVEYERFPETLLLRASESDLTLATNEGTPEAPHYVPTGSGPIPLDEVGYRQVMAIYIGAYSAPVTLRVISEEDADRVTGLSTAWRGTPNGAPHKGQEPDVTDATLSVEYGFGYRKETVPLTLDMVTGYDKTQAGDQTLHITYGEQSLDLPIRVADPDSTEVTRIVALVGWNESTRHSDDALVVPKDAYLEVEIGYGAQENRKVYLKDEEGNLNQEVEITGFTPKELEPQLLRITYCGFTYELEGFTIVNDQTREREYLSAPLALYLAEGEEFDLEAYTCRIGYNTGEDDVETLTFAELIDAGGSIVWTTPLDTDAPGSTAYFYLTLDALQSSTVVVYVSGEPPVTVDGIRLDVENAKIEYNVGDSLDLTGMKLYLVYSDNSEKDITDELFVDLFINFYTSTIGDRTATITYVCEEGPKATVFNYSVVA